MMYVFLPFFASFALFPPSPPPPTASIVSSAHPILLARLGLGSGSPEDFIILWLRKPDSPRKSSFRPQKAMARHSAGWHCTRLNFLTPWTFLGFPFSLHLPRSKKRHHGGRGLAPREACRWPPGWRGASRASARSVDARVRHLAEGKGTPTIFCWGEV